jgi:UDP-2-acetamido-3-amino-2,3-dideoxy-glucuronate N-acetyltransferase
MIRNIAIIGAGAWGKNLARNLHEIGVLAMISDPTEAAMALAEQYDLPHEKSFESALHAPEIKAVVIATPASTHFTIASAALDAGKDVYVEKPIALSMKEGLLLAAQAKAAGRILMVGHLLHYHPAYQKLRELVADGLLGEVLHITSSRQNLGTLRNEENVLWSFSPHDISMVLGIAASAPVSVSAVGSDFLQPGIVDIYTSHVRFANGTMADIRASWFNPDKVQKLTVIGSKAIAIFSDTLDWDRKVVVHEFTIEQTGTKPRMIRGDTIALVVPKGEPLRMEMEHFVDCITNRIQPRTDADEANRVLSVLQAAQTSLDSQGGWINV